MRPHELQHARPPCPSTTLGVYSDSRTLSQWCHSAISSSIVPFSSQHQSLLQWVNSSPEVAKYWSFSFSISLSKEHPGLISFRMDWWDLLAVLGTLKSLLQHHSSEASILPCSAFFTLQLSHPYMTIGKIQLWLCGPLLPKWCLFFNILSRFVIAFLLRSKHLLI